MKIRLRPKTIIVSKSPSLTIGGTVLKASVDLIIFVVTFDSNMSIEKHLHTVSRETSQKLCIRRKSWQVFHDNNYIASWEVLSGFVLPVSRTLLQCGARLPIHTSYYWTQ